MNFLVSYAFITLFLLDVALGLGCPFSGRYRNANGSLKKDGEFPTLTQKENSGASQTSFVQALTNGRPQGDINPTERPNARVISNSIFAQQNDIVDERGLSHMI
eukprot:Awhi_evm2s8154